MTKTIEFEEIVCCVCAVTFYVPEEFDELREDDGKDFYCPNGHGQRYTKTNAAQLADAKKELEETKVANRQLKCALLKEPPSPPPKTPMLKHIAAFLKHV